MKKIKNIFLYYFWRTIYIILKLCNTYKPVKNNNILVIDMQLIGDSVMVSPIFKNLKLNQRRGEKTDVLCSPLQLEIYKRCDGIDNIMTMYSYEEFIKNFHKKCLKNIYKFLYGYYLLDFALNNIINKYNVLILPRWDASPINTAVIALISGIENRFTYSEKVTKNKSVRNFWRDKYFTKVFTEKADIHESDKFLNLLEKIGFNVIDRTISLHYKKPYLHKEIPPRCEIHCLRHGYID